MSDEPAAKPTPVPRLERFKRALHVAVIVILLLIGARIMQRSLADAVVIEPVSVPRWLADSGYTPEVVAARLAGSMDDIFHSEQRPVQYFEPDRGSPFGTPASSRPALALPERDVLQDIEVPETKLSVKTFVELTRYLLGRKPSTIKGMLVQESDDTLRLMMEVHSKSLGVDAARAFVRKKSELDALLADGAHFAVEELAPYAEARDRFNSGDQIEALATARRLVRSRKCDNECRSMMCVLQAQILIGRSWDEAIAAYRDALAYDPKNTAAKIGMAYALADTPKKFAEATAELSEVLERDSKNVDALAALGWVQQKHAEQLGTGVTAHSQFAAAKATYLKVLAIDPMHAECEAGLGEIDYATGHPDEGEKHFAVAVALEPGNPVHRVNWATALFRAGYVAAAKDKIFEGMQATP
jgi:tetratricopeptide (TPR) repeat protein